MVELGASAALHRAGVSHQYLIAEGGRLVLGRGADGVHVDVVLLDMPGAPVQVSARAVTIHCFPVNVVVQVTQRLPGYLVCEPTGRSLERVSVTVDSQPLMTTETSLDLKLVLGNAHAGALPIGTVTFTPTTFSSLGTGTEVRVAAYPRHTWVRWLAGAHRVAERTGAPATIDAVRAWLENECVQQPTENTQEPPRALMQALHFFGLIDDPTVGGVPWPEALRRLRAAELPPPSLVEFALATREETGWSTPATVYTMFLRGALPTPSTRLDV